jgi:hypothetical protein
MNSWTHSWQWEWLPVALAVWTVVLGILAWMLASVGNHRPHHH